MPPVICGAKVMLYVQVEFAATDPPPVVGQVVPLAKVQPPAELPLKDTLLSVSGVDAAFWKVALSVLLDPTATVPKFSVVGVTFTAVDSPLINKPCFTSVKLP